MVCIKTLRIYNIFMKFKKGVMLFIILLLFFNVYLSIFMININ